MIANVKDILLAEEMLAELTDRSKMNESALRSELERIKKKSGSQSVPGMKPIMPSHGEELILLSALVSFPEKAEEVLSRFDIEAIRDETVRSIFRKMKMLCDRVSLTSLLDNAADAERALITRLSIDPGFDPELVCQNIDDCLQTIAYKSFEERKRAADAKQPDDATLLDSLLKEKRRLIKGANP
jgi:hypothetical protein